MEAKMGSRLANLRLVICRTYVETSWRFDAQKTLICMLRRAFGRCTVASRLPTSLRPEALGRLREGINPPP